MLYVFTCSLQTVALEGAPDSLVATVERYLVQERARLRRQREAAEVAAQVAEAAAAAAVAGGTAHNRTAGERCNSGNHACAAAQGVSLLVNLTQLMCPGSGPYISGLKLFNLLYRRAPGFEPPAQGSAGRQGSPDSGRRRTIGSSRQQQPCGGTRAPGPARFRRRTGGLLAFRLC